jgi:malate dehydrogenase
MSRKCVRVAVSGAAGNIGYALIFRIASGQMFGLDTDVELQLLEREEVLKSLHGIAMELDDCAFPLLKKVSCTADMNTAMNGANWVILVGAFPRGKDMERKDLLAKNGQIFKPQGRAINDHAADDVRVFVVGNPCNTNALIAMHNAPDVPNDRFYAMTALDGNRARMQLAIKAGVDVTAVKNMIVWGNHSNYQYPDFYHAKINGKPVTEVITDINWLQKEFVPMIQNRGKAVIEVRGGSSAASAAHAALTGVYNLVHESPAEDCYSMGCYSDGEHYGIDKGLIYSFPCRTDGGRLTIVHGFEHKEVFAQEKLAAVLKELREERDAVRALGFID